MAKNNLKLPPLPAWISLGDEKEGAEWIARGGDVNLRVSENIDLHVNEDDTLLHAAVRLGKPGVCRLLLTHGETPDVRNALKNTPLHQAVYLQKSRGEVCATLLEFGASVWATNASGRTPLHLAAYNNRMDMCKQLIDADPSAIHLVDLDLWHAAHWAALAGHTNICKLLAKAGLDLSAREKRGWTPLICAAKQGHTKACAVLLKAGSPVNEQDHGGLSALHWAAWGMHTETCKVLVEHGARCDLVNMQGKTPSDLLPTDGVSSLQHDAHKLLSLLERARLGETRLSAAKTDENPEESAGLCL